VPDLRPVVNPLRGFPGCAGDDRTPVGKAALMGARGTSRVIEDEQLATERGRRSACKDASQAVPDPSYTALHGITSQVPTVDRAPIRLTHGGEGVPGATRRTRGTPSPAVDAKREGVKR
jgi:hypothetical protein